MENHQGQKLILALRSIPKLHQKGVTSQFATKKVKTKKQYAKLDLLLKKTTQT